MTKADRAVKRETYSAFRGRPLVIELAATFLKIRQKGRRVAFVVTYDQVFTLGAKTAAEALRRDRAAARRVKKEAR